MRACMYARVDVEEKVGAGLFALHFILFISGSLREPGALLGWLANKLQGVSCVHPYPVPALELQTCALCLACTQC